MASVLPLPIHTLDVFEPGATVIVRREPALVLSVRIGFCGTVDYQVGFWLGGDWKEVWLPACEVDGAPHRQRSIGLLAS
jgi:hypothetical protein